MPGETLGEAYIEIKARVSQLKKDLAAAKTEVKQAAKEMEKNLEISPLAANEAWSKWFVKRQSDFDKFNKNFVAANKRSMEDLYASSATGDWMKNFNELRDRGLKIQKLFDDTRSKMDKTVNAYASKSSGWVDAENAKTAASIVEESAQRQIKAQRILIDGRRKLDEVMETSTSKRVGWVDAENAKTVTAQIRYANEEYTKQENLLSKILEHTDKVNAVNKQNIDILSKTALTEPQRQAENALNIQNNLATRWRETTETTKQYAAIQAQAFKDNKEFDKNIQNNLATQWERTSKATQQYGAIQERAFNENKKFLKDASQDAEGFNRTLERVQRTLIAIAAVVVARTLIEGFTKLVSVGMEYNKTVENVRLGIATLLSTGGQFVSSQGIQLEGVHKINAAYQESDKIIKQLELDNLKTAATFEQLAKAFQMTIKPAQNVGFTMDQTRKYTTAMVQAASTLGLNLDMLAEETRSMLRGTITPRNTIIATALGITNEDIRRYKGDTEGLYAFLMAKLKEFEIFGFETQKTFDGLFSNLKDSFSKLMGLSTKPFFENVKKSMKEIFDAIVKIDEKTGDVKFSEEFVRKAETLNRILNGMLTLVKDIGSYLARLDPEPLNKILSITGSMYDLWMKLPAGSGGLIGLLYFGAGSPLGIISGLTGIYNAVEKLKQQYNYSSEKNILESDITDLEKRMGIEDKSNVVRKPIPKAPSRYIQNPADWSGSKKGGSGAGPFDIGDIDQTIRDIEAKVDAMNQDLRDHMLDLDILIMEGAGNILGAELVKIGKWGEDAREKVWKNIADVQDKFTELDQKLNGKRGATSGAIDQESEAYKELVEAWNVGIETLTALGKLEEKKRLNRIREDYAANKIATAEYSKELAELTHNYKMVAEAERELVIQQHAFKLNQIDEAMNAGNLTAAQMALYEAYRKLYREKLRIAELPTGVKEKADSLVGPGLEQANMLEHYQEIYDELDRMRQADLEHENVYMAAKVQLWLDANEARLNATSQFFSNLAVLFGENSRAGKAMAIAAGTIDAILSGIKAYKAALDLGPAGVYLAPVFAAVAFAAQMAAVSRIASSPTYRTGGYTGNFPRDEEVGRVHGQEFVVNAEGTRRNRDILEAINRGQKFNPGEHYIPLNGGSTQAGAGKSGVNITIENYGTSKEYEQQITRDEIRIIAKDEVRKEAPGVIASEYSNPNSRVSKAQTRNTLTQRRRD